MSFVIDPMVSIVVPCFNAELYLKESLGSLSRQTYRNIEVIVVDDFSTDNSANVIRDCSLIDPRIKYIKNISKGANTARSVGVLYSSGQYLAFMDADDRWDEGAFALLMKIATESRADLICCNMNSVNGDDVTKLYCYSVLNEVVSAKNDCKFLLEVPPTACAKLFSASLLKDVIFDDVPFTQIGMLPIRG
ncbi:MAG: glycosyltransferase family 2 protein [Betaproteobacteria bacterium]|nr:glycosyltransferase family 2 protein [Betaproteobacteria bacterium]